MEEKELQQDNFGEMYKDVVRSEAELKHNRKIKRKTDDPWVEMKKANAQLVEGRFRNIESPGSELTFSYNMHIYKLQDGEIYKLPLEVARHLNNCAYTIHETAIDAAADGFKPSARVNRKIDRFAFESLVYTSENKFGPVKRLHEVEY